MTCCPLCREGDLEDFEMHFNHAMRSDGLVMPEPLAKQSCLNCGALVGCNSDSDATYQRSDGSSVFDIARHREIAAGLANLARRYSAAGEVLEVGAASFQTALELAALMPDSSITAVEPSPEQVPDTDRIHILTCSIEQANLNRRFGLIYSNHVLEHISDTRAFLTGLRDLLAQDGILVICCPSGLVPSHELLFADHLYHFTPYALARAAADAGLDLVADFPAPWEPLSHVFVLKAGYGAMPAACRSPGEWLLSARKAYVQAWEAAETALLPRMPKVSLLFGAGEFSQLIRAYLPRVYQRVAAITLDSITGARDFDRPVVPLDQLDLTGKTILLGVHPASTARLREKLLALGAKAVLSVDLPQATPS